MSMKVKKELILGVSMLIVVVVLWVGSAALSRYLYTEGHYNKPFFTTYFKTSLLSIYLIGFTFWRPWQRLCCFWAPFSRLRQRRRNTEYSTNSVRSGTGTSARLRRRGEEQQALLSEENEGGRGIGRLGNVICVKVTPDGVEEEDEFSSKDGDGLEKGEWSPRTGGGSRGGSNDVECVTGNAVRRRSGDGEGVARVELEGCGNGLHKASTGCKKTCPIPILEGSDDRLHLIGCLKSPDWKCPLKSSPPITTPSPSSSSSTHLPSSSMCMEEDHQRQQGVCLVGEGQEVCPVGEVQEVCPVGEGPNCPFLRYYKLKTCTLGPPENMPLCCDLAESDREKNGGSVPACQTKCCKVSFCSQVEVRKLMKSSGESPVSVRKFDRSRDVEKHVRSLPSVILPVHHVMLLSLVFGIIWFFANYLYSAALSHSSVAVVNTMSATSGVFVMVLAGLPCLTVTDGDKFTFPRCLVTLISVAGLVLVALSSSGQGEDDEQKKSSVFGALLALGGSVLYALYLVLLRRFVKDTDSLEIPMFFGFVGLFDFLGLLPVLVLWHYANVELFEVPPTPNTWTLLLVNGLAGTVLSELFWLWGVFLTSPLLGTLALSLVTPISITYSIVMGDAVFSWMFLLGAVLVFLGFVGVVILEYLGAWDPVWAFLKKLYSKDVRGYSESGHATFSPSPPPLSPLLISDFQSPQS